MGILHYHNNNTAFIKHYAYGNRIYSEYIHQTQVPPKELVIILGLLSWVPEMLSNSLYIVSVPLITFVL